MCTGYRFFLMYTRRRGLSLASFPQDARGLLLTGADPRPAEVPTISTSDVGHAVPLVIKQDACDLLGQPRKLEVLGLVRITVLTIAIFRPGTLKARKTLPDPLLNSSVRLLTH